jgi:ABC-type bacteriocin/lantibiotic exporter with double-glycine peptidase domain
MSATLHQEPALIGFRADCGRIAELGRLFAPHWPKLAAGVGLFLVARSALLMVPLVSSRVIDHVLPARDRAQLDQLIAGAVGLTLLAIAASVSKDLVVSRTTNSLVVDLRRRMQETLRSLPYETLQRWKPGYWMSRLDADVSSFSVLSGDTVVGLLEDVISIILASILIVYVAAQLGLILLVFAPLLVMSAVVLTRRLSEMARNNRERWGRYLGFLEDEVRSALLVKSLGVEERRDRHGRRLLWLAGRAELRLTLRHRIIAGASSIIALMLPVAVLWFGMRQVMDGDITLGNFVAFNTYVVYVTAPINRLIALFRQFRISAVSFDRIREVLALPREGGALLDAFRFAIELESVHVRFDDGRVGLHDVSLRIPRGHHVALVGQNGSGKSTLLRVIQGYHTPTAGQIVIDGADIKNVHPAALRRLFGYVAAGAQLLDGTLAENLAFGATGIGATDLRRLLDEIAFFEGTGFSVSDLDRRVSEIGSRLSDGQRQLVAIVRMLLRRPEIAVIDEGMSFLDGLNQQRVLEVLRRRLAGTTVLWATHGYQHIADFDSVLVLSGGRVVSHGTVEEAVGRSGWFNEVFSGDRAGAPLACAQQCP